METNPTYEINISGLRLFAYHGVHPEENKLGQEFKLDLSLEVMRTHSTIDDSISSVLSYWDVIETVKEQFTGKTFKLLETAAENLLDCLARYPQILHAKIELKKITPPIPVTVDFVGVIIQRNYRD